MQIVFLISSNYFSGSSNELLGSEYKNLSKWDKITAYLGFGANYFKIKSDTRGLNYEKYFSDGNNSKTLYDEYNSSNTKILSKEELIQILLKLPEVKSHIN